MRGLSRIFIRVPTGLTGRATSPLRSTEILCASSGSAYWPGPLAFVTVDANVDHGTEWLAWWLLIPPGQPISTCSSSLPRPSGDSGLGSYDRVARDGTPVVVGWSCGKPWTLTRRLLSEAPSQAVQTSHISSCDVVSVPMLVSVRAGEQGRHWRRGSSSRQSAPRAGGGQPTSTGCKVARPSSPHEALSHGSCP